MFKGNIFALAYMTYMYYLKISSIVLSLLDSATNWNSSISVCIEYSAFTKLSIKGFILKAFIETCCLGFVLNTHKLNKKRCTASTISMRLPSFFTWKYLFAFATLTFLSGNAWQERMSRKWDIFLQDKMCQVPSCCRGLHTFRLYKTIVSLITLELVIYGIHLLISVCNNNGQQVTHSSNLDVSSLSSAGNISKQAPMDKACPSGDTSRTLQ